MVLGWKKDIQCHRIVEVSVSLQLVAKVVDPNDSETPKQFKPKKKSN